MFFAQIRAGGDRNFSYVIADEESREAAVIDPGDPPKEEQDIISKHRFTLLHVINTHDHFDHTGGNDELSLGLCTQIAMYESASSKKDIELRDGDVIALGSLRLEIIHTPGHTPDSICIHVGNELITGDTLFVGKVGGTGFGDDARAEYDSLHNRIMTLPPQTRVWPGHDYGVRPQSTIGDELRENPFLLRETFDDFIDLKKNWAEYKRIHGIQ